MRYVIPWVGLGGLLLAAGCTNSRLSVIGGGGNTLPSNASTPTVAALVKYMDDNAQRVRSLRCDDMDLGVSHGIIQLVNLRTQLACQQPRSFRMSANLAGNDEVDLGSNDQEFWFWIRKMDPHQFFCPYQALDEKRPVRLPFPFQPSWVMETLGMGSYGPPERYQLVVEGNRVPERYKLVEHTTGPQGNKVRKVIVFNAREQKDHYPQITDFLLLDDATGKELCSAKILEVHRDASGTVVPRRLQLRWPEEKITLTLRLSRPVLNAQLPGPLFVRRPLAGQPSINLATGRPEGQPTGLQRVGAQGRPPRAGS
jgi:hypothetical protein